MGKSQKVPILHDFHGFLYLCLTAWVHGIFSRIISKLTTSLFMAFDLKDREENPTKKIFGKMYFSTFFSKSLFFLSFWYNYVCCFIVAVCKISTRLALIWSNCDNISWIKKLDCGLNNFSSDCFNILLILFWYLEYLFELFVKYPGYEFESWIYLLKLFEIIYISAKTRSK